MPLRVATRKKPNRASQKAERLYCLKRSVGPKLRRRGNDFVPGVTEEGMNHLAGPKDRAGKYSRRHASKGELPD